jgi:hypothetical protein
MQRHILANAELVRAVAADELGVVVNYDEAGVRWLDDYIDQQRSKASEEVKAALPRTLGSFLGECIRRSHGGEWEQNKETSQWTVRVTDRVAVFPFNKVRKQLAGAEGESVVAFFQSITALIASARPNLTEAQASPSAPQRSK